VELTPLGAPYVVLTLAGLVGLYVDEIPYWGTPGVEGPGIGFPLGSSPCSPGL